jgi:SOS-response transcriptional repressor LexA
MTAEEAIFKQLEFDGEQYFLKPLNPRYPTMLMPADAKIAGVVTGTWLQE